MVGLWQETAGNVNALTLRGLSQSGPPRSPFTIHRLIY
jgi:hypothetical protein